VVKATPFGPHSNRAGSPIYISIKDDSTEYLSFSFVYRRKKRFDTQDGHGPDRAHIKLWRQSDVAACVAVWLCLGILG